MLDKDVQDRIQELVLELVHQVQAEARKFYRRAPHALDKDELAGIGNDALVWASVNWERYCEKNGYSPAATEYFRAYALRRIRGAIMDHQRAQDWVPRAVRTRYKQIQLVEESSGRLEETGMEASLIRATVAAVARRPVSLDERTEDVPGETGVESQAVAGSVLDALGAVQGTLPVLAQAVLALRFYRGMALAEIAEELRLPEAEVQDLHDTTVLSLHRAMLGRVA